MIYAVGIDVNHSQREDGKKVLEKLHLQENNKRGGWRG
jgi:hypothetical protein